MHTLFRIAGGEKEDGDGGEEGDREAGQSPCQRKGEQQAFLCLTNSELADITLKHRVQRSLGLCMFYACLKNCSGKRGRHCERQVGVRQPSVCHQRVESFPELGEDGAFFLWELLKDSSSRSPTMGYTCKLCFVPGMLWRQPIASPCNVAPLVQGPPRVASDASVPESGGILKVPVTTTCCTFKYAVTPR